MSGTIDEKSPSNPMNNVGTVSYGAERSRQEAFDLIREIAGSPGKPVKGALDRVRVRLTPYIQLGLNRVEELWYGQVRLIRAEEMDALRAAAAERRRKVEAGRAAANELATGYRQIAERLRAVDEDFYRAEINRLERNAGALCAVDRAGAAPVADQHTAPIPSQERSDGR